MSGEIECIAKKVLCCTQLKAQGARVEELFDVRLKVAAISVDKQKDFFNALDRAVKLVAKAAEMLEDVSS